MLPTMTPVLSQKRDDRLERLCGLVSQPRSTLGNWIWIGPRGEGIECLEAHLLGQAFAPHRHDTYAIGITLSGVQSFHYRGEKRHCLPGQCHILHPDETHDGGSGTDEGFGYRMVYVDPWLVQQALGTGALPFVSDPVIDGSLLAPGFKDALWGPDRDIDEDGQVEISVAVATFLSSLASGGVTTTPRLALTRLSRIRDLLMANPTTRHSMRELEALSGLDRWTIARQFRAAFGTSPSRFRTMRQLDLVRRLLGSGTTLAQAAAEAGFADQSHMSRHFKSTYGRTPADWVATSRRPHGVGKRAVFSRHAPS
jgi:AraC-like DNA-binding protein